MPPREQADRAFPAGQAIYRGFPCGDVLGGRLLPMRKPEEMTLSRRKDATVSRISFTSGSRNVGFPQGYLLQAELRPPAEVKFCNK